MIWMISANEKKYDHAASFKKNGFIDWIQNANYEVGDIVYIYCSRPYKRVMYKCEVVSHSMIFSQCIGDKEFWKDNDQYNKGKDGYFVRLKLIEKVDNDKLRLEYLKDYGLKAAPQGPIKVSETLNNYISEFFDNINDKLGKKDSFDEMKLDFSEVEFLQKKIFSEDSAEDFKQMKLDEYMLVQKKYSNDAGIEDKPETINIEDVIKQFKIEKLEECQKRIDEAEALRQKFVSDYSIEDIKNMKLDEYMFATKGIGYDNSFCRRIRYELEGLAHMGNVYPDIFGIYLKKDKVISLSKTLKNEVGNDDNLAFKSIKRQIVDLLIAAKGNKYDEIANSKLNSSFKHKLLLIYYPDKYFPVCTKKTLDEYCKIAGITFTNNEDMIYRNIALMEWKKTSYPFCKWSNALVMMFCDWVWRENKKFNLNKLHKSSIIEVKNIEQELDKLNLEGQDREAVVKVRVNQDVFRKILLDKYSKCCLCNVNKKDFLIASHIKPWSKCEPNEKLDVNNGLLLCPNHDRLFDGGWISFDEQGKILISKEIEDINKKLMNINDLMTIKITDDNEKYMEYHRKNVYKL